MKRKDGTTRHSTALKLADQMFSRLRRTQWAIDTTGSLDYAGFHCVTCGAFTPIMAGDCGHCVPRGVMELRFCEQNTAGQCGKCNRFNNGETVRFLHAIQAKYGANVRATIEEAGNRRATKKYTVKDLLDIARESQDTCVQLWEKEGEIYPWAKTKVPTI